MSAATSIWNPFRQPAFRRLWICGAIFFIGAGMQTMAAVWLMVELTGSSFLAARVQTAVFLPMFLLALPAGAVFAIAGLTASLEPGIRALLVDGESATMSHCTAER